MPLAGKSIWLRAEHAIEAVGGSGAALWSRPPEVRRAIAELASVFPSTHLVIDLDAVRKGAGPDPSWKALLARSEGWNEHLGELVPAVASALRPPCAFGFGLPDPRTAAADLGDASDRGTLKAGLQIASFLQGFRSAGLGLAVLMLDAAAGGDVARAATPVLRNAGLYGWRRGVELPGLDAAPPPETDVRLVKDAVPAELEAAWARGEEVGGGLDAAFWTGGGLGGPAPAAFLLYGRAPAGLDVSAIVGAGRRLREWCG